MPSLLHRELGLTDDEGPFAAGEEGLALDDEDFDVPSFLK